VFLSSRLRQIVPWFVYVPTPSNIRFYRCAALLFRTVRNIIENRRKEADAAAAASEPKKEYAAIT
jgi:hypothetical protein